MEYSKEQVKAAYALNLCTVSISQIIDYKDVNIMEQEYEAILNNLNLEQMPKDEALLKILKQILDIITFFRIQEGDKRMIDKEYQQKMKNAIWSASPNIGLLVAGGSPVTMAVSLASQVGIGYMNYRRAKADGELEREKQRWLLERTAIEQFNGLRRELFDTAWRLSDTYNFPDQLRLTERQISQYNDILMDNDLIRKYERLNTIQDSFVAYPPFWYHFGNTANRIAGSSIPLSKESREQYRGKARAYFEHYRSVNQQGLLREDPVSSACALELLDLLDPIKERDLCKELLEEAIHYSGRENDILQLAALAYLKLDEREKAANLMRELVNEQYNTVLNAQLLSSLYVGEIINDKSAEALSGYEILRSRVGDVFLYPLPESSDDSVEILEEEFVKGQRIILEEKYDLVMRKFAEKYAVRFGRIIPATEMEANYDDAYFLFNDPQKRLYQMRKVFEDPRKADAYCAMLQETGLSYSILDLLNDMFDAVCRLDFLDDAAQDRLSDDIEIGIKSQKTILNGIQVRLSEPDFGLEDMRNLLDVHFSDFTSEFFRDLKEEIAKHINTRQELQDFAISEQKLGEFCEKEGLPDPDELYGKEGDKLPELLPEEMKHFDLDLLGEEAVTMRKAATNSQMMIDMIKEVISKVVISETEVEFYTNDDPKIDRYFSTNYKLKNRPQIRKHAIAVLDDRSEKDDFDLIFTTYGVIPIKDGDIKRPVSYKDIEWATGRKKELWLNRRFSNDAVEMDALFELIQKLKEVATPIPDDLSMKVREERRKPDIKLPDIKLPDIKNPFAKR